MIICLFLQMLSSKDINFVGYTYKNFEIINDHQLPGIEDEAAEAPSEPVKGSFLSLLPPKLDSSEQSGNPNKLF
ncbi:hypothetical protein NC652_019959 [Populus alba x Populus x berolinensis]|nr:hypothetical protein NC652_019959 [Populus alba x Populus x berolinensis]